MCTYVIYACLYNVRTNIAVKVFHIQHIMQHSPFCVSAFEWILASGAKSS